MRLKLYRDKVVSITKRGERVGVYVKMPHDLWSDTDTISVAKGTEILLAEMTPQKADRIIAMWEGKQNTKVINALNRIDELASGMTADNDYGEAEQLEKDYNVVFDYLTL